MFDDEILYSYIVIKANGSGVHMTDMKKIACVISCMVIALIFASCGKESFVKKAEDGTKVEIIYVNHGFLSRSPVFEKSDTGITMKFNGHEWYTAAIIGPGERDRAAKGEYAAHSDNIIVYKNRGDDYFPFSYIMTLDGADSAWILFRSVDSPEMPGYGTDFGFCIQYFAGKTETVPDTDFIIENENEN